MPIKVTVDQAAVDAFLTGPNGPVVQMVTTVCRRVLNEARRRCPVDEGKLRSSLDMAVRVEGTRVVGRVGSDLDYAIYVHEGTGLYGPKQQRIYPVSMKVMTWIPRTKGQGSKTGKKRKSKAETTRVFAQWTRGMEGRPFLTDALEAVSPFPVVVHRRV